MPDQVLIAPGSVNFPLQPSRDEDITVSWTEYQNGQFGDDEQPQSYQSYVRVGSDPDWPVDEALDRGPLPAGGQLPASYAIPAGTLPHNTTTSVCVYTPHDSSDQNIMWVE
jgi:hypothetical protein